MSSVMPLTPMHQNNEVELVLYAPDNRHMARLGAMLTGHAPLRWLDSRDISARQLIDTADEDVLVLLDYCGTNASYSSDLARQLTALGSTLPMIGVSAGTAEQAVHILSAMRAGVRDFIDIDGGAPQTVEVLERVHHQSSTFKTTLATTPVAAPNGRLIVLLGVRAGMGTTTLATHLGTELAQRMCQKKEGREQQQTSRTLLVDIGQPAGDAALYLELTSTFTYEEALRNVDRIDPTFTGSALALHSSSLSLLGTSSGTLLRSHEPAPLLTRLRSVFALTLCDTGGLPIQRIPTSLLKQASEIWLIADQTIGSLVSMDQALRDLDQRGLRDDRLQLLVNRYDPNGGISDEQIAQRFDVPLLATLPERTRALRSSTGLGRLLTESAPRDPYVRALAPLLQRLDRRQPDTASLSTSPAFRLANFLGRESWKKK